MQIENLKSINESRAKLTKTEIERGILHLILRRREGINNSGFKILFFNLLKYLIFLEIKKPPENQVVFRGIYWLG
ncbi:hypothetical protein [Moheibacter sediminis]|uniref:hypothetical protein n=1 Tax=Moheibacter sediminis TaxID=1434700 RepID=UPI0009FDE919|nr:hypothetical protein [Moheibacter sediminis]